MLTTSLAPRQATLLIIMDGVGHNPDKKDNAIEIAQTPRLDYYFSNYPSTLLHASSLEVGLPDGQMGNSEVGHMTIGAGRVLKQDIVRIDSAIEDGSFFHNPVLVQAVLRAKQRNRPVHLLGLSSDGGVHSHVRHLKALIQLCAQHEVIPVVHMITDGRDTAPCKAMDTYGFIEPALAEANGQVATICGRYYAMDRDKRWERTQAAWLACCFGIGQAANSVPEALEAAYAQGVSDEFISPVVIANSEKIENDDDVIFYNFRNDRARQLTYVLAGQDFKPFERGQFTGARLTCLTEYDPALDLPIAFAPDFPKSTLASVISDAGLKQFHCSETEKYAHVTFFLNGGRQEPNPGEDWSMIASPNVATYDLAPAMSAAAVADSVIDALESHQYSFVVVNFANGDMVGHTAIADSVIEAVEVLDEQVGRVLDSAVRNHFSVILTADHGNCDLMVDPETGEPHTQHTNFPVPCLIIDKDAWQPLAQQTLANIAPTILQFMGLKKPESMNQAALVQKTDDNRVWINKRHWKQA
ncbi:MAG: 2,3-bisphosphoglycerate-independent phosphoglycerate mutase [Gammaproteobacteria bacterium]|nr:2,3-bisphosphoglycerate-independent phosphoglycerate mutase [Gammaproteobacteria bacterium]MDH5728306.1 2,3-bisphosphoglycerate-independent phosphoglycerate mutase [Gammaproteobacteria bacterium]